MSDWKEHKLGELVTIINGFAFKSHDFCDSGSNDTLPVVKIKNVANGDVHLNDVKYYAISEDLSKFIVSKGEILMALTGNHPELETQVVGLTSRYKLNQKAYVNQRVARIESKNKAKMLDDYLYYFLKDKNTHLYLASQSSGSANQANISKSDIENTPIDLPHINTQRAISETLKSLDDKLDLLHYQNKTLEELAETLFRQWFVEEADDSWQLSTLEHEFDFVMGQSPLGSDLNDRGEGIVFFQGRTDFTFRYPTARIYTTAPTRMARKYDTLVSVRAPVGDMNMAYDECCLGRGVAAFRFKANPSYFTYTYYKLRSLMMQIKQFDDNGTVFGSIGKDDFKNLENIIPSKDLILRFQNAAKPFDDKIYSNSKQIRTLTQLRDTLLPKLMSGEVKAKN